MSANHFTEIKRNLGEKLADARKNHVRIVVVSMRNDKYKNAIIGGANTLAKENNQSSARSRAGEIGTTLLEQFKSSGARHFFKAAVDDEEIAWSEALKSKFDVSICI